MHDGKVCPDCLAIAAQQKREGYTWNEWLPFGVPRSGHTVCRDHCRCRLVPYLYVQVSTELQHMSIMAEGELPPRSQHIIDMIGKWEEAGYAKEELNLLGLSEKAQEEYLEKQLIAKNIIKQEKQAIAAEKPVIKPSTQKPKAVKTRVKKKVAKEPEAEYIEEISTTEVIKGNALRNVTIKDVPEDEQLKIFGQANFEKYEVPGKEKLAQLYKDAYAKDIKNYPLVTEKVHIGSAINEVIQTECKKMGAIGDDMYSQWSMTNNVKTNLKSFMGARYDNGYMDYKKALFMKDGGEIATNRSININIEMTDDKAIGIIKRILTQLEQFRRDLVLSGYE